MPARFLRTLNRFLNGVTMYRLLLYGLWVLAAVAFALAFLDALPFSVWALTGSLVASVVACYGTNWVLARVWKVASNSESYLLTALILFFILPPTTTAARLAAIFVAAVVAIASKYLLVLRRRNVFNPAAIGAVIIGLLGLLQATWWVGSGVLLPFTLVLGLLVVHKIRRFPLVISFTAVSLFVTLLLDAHHGFGFAVSLRQAFVSSPLIFFGTIMLTEPSTMPPRRLQRILYGAFTGAVFACQVHVGSISATPEIALALANILAFAANPSYNLRLRLKRKTQLGPKLYDFSFTPDRPLIFMPGQYAAWTLPLAHKDSRGNRRMFTMASSPTEKEIHIGVKFSEPSSKFKRALLAMQPGDAVEVGQIAGDFTLPKDPAQKLVFVAGGIGVTPFRSMLKYLLDTGQKRDIVVLYVVTRPGDLVYDGVLRQAEMTGVRIVKVLTHTQPPDDWKGLRGHLTSEIFAREVPDYATRVFYLSGPKAMVDAGRAVLRKLGVKRRHIVLDYFPGY